MTTRFNIVLATVILIVGAPYYWLLISDPAGSAAPKGLTIAQLRKSAEAIPGENPVSIRYDSASARTVPRSVLAAGQGVKEVAVERRSYKLTYSGQPPIVIEGGITLVEAAGFGFRSFVPEALERMNRARNQAQMVVSLGKGQRREQVLDKSACAKPHPLAPGLVEIMLCEKLVAQRLIYVRLEDGREYLLAGDVAPTMANVLYQAGPSRLMNDYYVAQDRTAIHSWLATIARLKAQAPALEVIPGHDQLPFKQMKRNFDES